MQKREAKYYHLSTGIFLRLGKTDDILDQYNRGYIKFGCPANWINYNRKNGIADKYEALIGHVHKNDTRLSLLSDDGIPLNMFRSLWQDEGPDDTVYVRYIWHCLMPALCLFSLPIKQLAKSEKLNNTENKKLRINLKLYFEAMDFDIDDCSLIMIYEPAEFIKDLEQEIPRTISTSSNVTIIDPDHSPPFLASMVKYDLDIDKLFFEINSFDDIFRKRPIYANQSEARIIIPWASFVRDPVGYENSYKDNQLTVQLPNIKNYCQVFAAKDVHVIDFFDFNDDYSRYEIGVR